MEIADTDSDWDRPLQTSAEWLARCSQGAVNAGLDFETLLASSLIPVRDHGAIEITVAQQLLLTLNIVNSLQDEAHGLCSRRVPLGSTAVMLSAMGEGRTLEAALHRMVRFFNLSHSAFKVEVRPSRSVVDIAVLASAPDATMGALIEERWASMVFQAICWFIGRRIPLLKFQVCQPDHPAMGQLHPILAGPVTYGGETLLRFPVSYLRLPRRAPPTEQFVLAVQEGWITRAPFAQVGPQGREGQKSAIVQAAIRRLRSSSSSLEEIASELGYAEARSLRRLVKIKTGLTPREIRAHQPREHEGADSRLSALAAARVRTLLADAHF